jgi:hypothetical protein
MLPRGVIFVAKELEDKVLMPGAQIVVIRDDSIEPQAIVESATVGLAEQGNHSVTRVEHRGALVPEAPQHSTPSHRVPFTPRRRIKRKVTTEGLSHPHPEVGVEDVEPITRTEASGQCENDDQSDDQ